MLFFGILLVALGLCVLIGVVLKRRAMGLPKGKLVVADSENWDRCERELFSPRYRLVGRPDYLFRERGRFIPVEVKSGHLPSSPYASHVFQLMAYCLLVEEVTGLAPPYGIIAYRNGRLQIKYTPTLKSELLEILEEMRKYLTSGREIEARESRKCLRCGYRRACYR